MNNTLAPMRGIQQAIAELKAADPNTALTEKGLRRLILEGTIPSIKIGRKNLINMNVLNSYLCGEYTGAVSAANNANEYGTIRRISG